MAITDLVVDDKKKAKIGLLQLDASIEETHTSSVEATNHAVESGSDITDHIRKLPDEITISGMVTNTPIVLNPSDIRSPVEGAIGFDEDRVEVANAELERIQNEGVLVDVITTFKEYSNMCLLSKSVTRNASKGNVLDVTLVLREIFVANSISIDLPDPVEISNRNKKERGKKVKSPATSKQTEKSQSIVSRLTGFFGS